jgi:hypothetical protein
MRVRMSLASLLLLTVVFAGLWAQENVLPKGEEELFGTWVNEKNSADVLHGQKVVVTADAMMIYSKASDLEACMQISWDISSKWADSDGNVWYNTLGTSVGGVYKGAKWQTLEKLSKSGTVWERAMNLLETGRFNPAFYPRNIDPKANYYQIFYRAGR